MDSELEHKFNRMHRAFNLQRSDRMSFSGDWGTIEYRKHVYHLGEPELVSRMGQVVVSNDGTRRYTRDGGVWAVGDKEQYEDYDDVLCIEPEQFEVEQVGPAMLGEMVDLSKCLTTSWTLGPMGCTSRAHRWTPKRYYNDLLVYG